MIVFIRADFDENELKVKKFKPEEELEFLDELGVQDFKSIADLKAFAKTERGREILEDDGDMWVVKLLEDGSYEGEWHSYEVVEV